MKDETKSIFKLRDSVLHRMVQIFQEAILVGVDCADLLRQMELKPDESDPHVLVLTEDYVDQIKRWHKQLLDDADRLSEKIKDEKPDNSKKLIMS